jgi:hypothetical protein
MTTAAVDNPQNRSLNNVQIYGDKQARESSFDYIAVGAGINKGLAKMSIESISGENTTTAVFSRNYKGSTAEEELFRVQAFDGTSTYHTLLFKHNMSTELTRIVPKTKLYIEKETQIGDGAWNGQRLKLGGYNLWVDSTGRLRIKNGVPTSDTDGTVVGSQV